jgi:transposase
MSQPDSDPQENSEASSEEHWLLDELSADAQRKLEWAAKIRDARAASDKALGKRLIQEAAKDLECHPRTITRMLSAVETDGLIALTRNSRSDKGKARYISEPWRKLVIELYIRGNKYSRRTNQHQVWLLIQGITAKLNSIKTSSDESHKELFDWIATKLGSGDEAPTSVLNKILKGIKKEMASGELKPPRSHVAVYKILRTHLEAKSKKPRHPGQGPLSHQDNRWRH